MRTHPPSSAPPALKACAAFVVAALPALALSQSFEYKRFQPGLNVAPPPAVVQEPTPTPPTLEAALQLSTSRVIFEDTPIGGSLLKQVALTNTGTAPLTFTAVPTVQGAGFSPSTTTCGSSLAVLADCLVEVRFAPSGSGAFSGKLVLSTPLVSSPHEVALQGNGFNPLSLASASLTAGTSGSAYSVNFASYFSVTGEASPTLSEVSWSVVSGALPSGMTLSAAGVLSGSPATIGNYSFGVRATYRGNSVTTTYALAVTAPTDSDWASVTTLLNFEGTAGATTLTEPTKGLTLTFAGSAQLSAQRKFGNTSLSVVSGYVTMPGSRFAVGTRPFTLEAFVRRNTAATGNLTVLDTRPSGTNGPYITLTVGGNGDIAYYASTANRVYAPTGTIPNDGAWYHLAYSRDATGTGRLFVNGVQVGANYADGLNYIAATTVAIGKNSFGTTQAGGYVDAMRLTDGVGRYVTNFTPPSTDYPTQ